MGHKVIPPLSYQSVAENNVTGNCAIGSAYKNSQLSAKKKTICPMDLKIDPKIHDTYIKLHAKY